MKKDIPPGKLLSHAQTIAKDNSLEALYEKTKLPISWLRKFKAGTIAAPSVQRVEKIIVAMTGRELL